jgi:hypothetical protein
MHQHNRDVNLAGDRASRLTPTRDARIVGSSGRVCCKSSHFLRHQIAVWAPALHQAIRRTVFDDLARFQHHHPVEIAQRGEAMRDGETR